MPVNPHLNSCFLLCFYHASKQQLLHPPLDKYAGHEVMYAFALKLPELG